MTSAVLELLRCDACGRVHSINEACSCSLVAADQAPRFLRCLACGLIYETAAYASCPRCPAEGLPRSDVAFTRAAQQLAPTIRGPAIDQQQWPSWPFVLYLFAVPIAGLGAGLAQLAFGWLTPRTPTAVFAGFGLTLVLVLAISFRKVWPLRGKLTPLEWGVAWLGTTPVLLAAGLGLGATLIPLLKLRENSLIGQSALLSGFALTVMLAWPSYGWLARRRRMLVRDVPAGPFWLGALAALGIIFIAIFEVSGLRYIRRPVYQDNMWIAPMVWLWLTLVTAAVVARWRGERLARFEMLLIWLGCGVAIVGLSGMAINEIVERLVPQRQRHPTFVLPLISFALLATLLVAWRSVFRRPERTWSYLAVLSAVATVGMLIAIAVKRPYFPARSGLDQPLSIAVLAIETPGLPAGHAMSRRHA